VVAVTDKTVIQALIKPQELQIRVGVAEQVYHLQTADLVGLLADQELLLFHMQGLHKELLVEL
jgi:hypothetical protein